MLTECEIKYIKRVKLFLLSISFLSFSSCSNILIDKSNLNSISIKLNVNKSFSIKSSSSGLTKKLKSDISLIRVYLVNNNSSNLNDSNIKFGPLDLTSSSTGTLLTFFNNLKDSSGSGSLTFYNVGQGTYYVAVSAYENTSTIDETTNITDISNTTSGAYSTITSGSTNLGRFAISTSGGDSNSGSVEIGNLATGYRLVNNGTDALNVDLKLRSEVGATIDSTVTITNGSSSIPSTTME